MTIRAIIFDMDGLMIDSERLYFRAERDIGASFGKAVGAGTLRSMMGRSPIEGMRILVEALALPISPAEAAGMRDDLMRRMMRTDLEAMPGLDHILDAFHGRLKLAIATGAQGEFLDIALDRLGIRGRFDVLQTSDGIAKGKPDPEIYRTTCGRLGLGPAECVVLEDSENGVRAARGAGCFVIAVPSDYTRTQDFRSADLVVRDLDEAAGLIEALLRADRP